MVINRPVINIGLDADDFIFDTEGYTDERSPEYFQKKYNMKMLNPAGYNIQEQFCCTEDQQKEFWKSIFLSYSIFARPRANFVPMLQALKSLPYVDIHFHIVTSKYKALEPKIGKIIKAAFEMGLEIHGIRKYIDKIHYCSLEKSVEDKVRVCKENNITIFGEDSAKNILALRDVCDVICMNTRNNGNVELGNVPRINNFNEFYVECMKIIDSLLNQNSIFTQFRKLDRISREALSPEGLEDYYIAYTEYIRQLPFDKRKMVNGETFQRFIYHVYGKHFVKPIIIGKELIPTNEPLVFVSNHECDKDFFILSAGLGTIAWHPLLKKEFLSMGFKGKILDLMYAVYVDRDKKESKADSLIDMTKISINGGSPLFFAEGTFTSNLTTTENVGPFSPGYCYLAQMFGRRVVPIALTQDYLRGLKPVIRFSEPVAIGVSDDIDLENNKIRDTISNCIEENKRLQLKL